MRFTCTRDNLLHALDVVSPLAGKHTHLPILTNVLIQASESRVEFVSTNLEVAVRAHVRAKVDTAGAYTVPAKTLSDYIHLITTEQVEIIQEGAELAITAGSSSTKIKGAPADDYPVIPAIDEDHAYAANREVLKTALSRVAIAVAKNEIRPELSGINWQFFPDRYPGLVLAATDSYRLAEAKMPLAQGADKNITSLVPARVVYEIVRLLTLTKDIEAKEPVRLWVSDNQIAVRYDIFELTARLIQGKYPDYTQIIPSSFKTAAVFPVDLMVNKIKAASLFTAAGVNAVSFDLNVAGQTVGVSSTSTQTGEHSSELEADVKGEENSILLNHRYVLDGLQHLGGAEAVLHVNSADAPCMLKPKEETDYLYIVMPIRQ
ncbi:MAG: polymerase III subunit beta protein [Candidatus Magasanikbacteria bacterium GW2011_GWA2_56_11]|uniref:Beta sliding clamp n=1 Tax=Candidatus Magasanikbacteria bacterium GW2011_GWA2_56_11 TaxID=1619044 RepID=A0A0G2B909_9BACT|nr:MAG: polymerase III subunit beta protein [Candidatus Magasanikbacteria bacterium GW2011_GWA2_56_11]